MKTTRDYSDKQEKELAKMFNGKPTVNSGGTKFGGGDVLTKDLFIEAKTTTTDRQSFPIKKEWLEKAREQAFEQHKNFWTLAFRFSPDGRDYYVVDKKCIDLLIEKIGEGNND